MGADSKEKNSIFNLPVWPLGREGRGFLERSRGFIFYDVKAICVETCVSSMSNISISQALLLSLTD